MLAGGVTHLVNFRPNGQKTASAVGTEDAAGLQGEEGGGWVRKEIIMIEEAGFQISYNMTSNVKQERVPVAHLFHSTPQPSAPSYESGTSPPQITPNRAGKLISFGMEAPSEGTISDEAVPVQVV